MVDTRFAVSVHLLTVLANSAGDKLNSEALARNVDSNPAFVRKLLADLVKADLVKSYRGKSGGVELGRPAREVTLKDVYQAVADKRLLAVHDKAPLKKCPVSCSMKAILEKVADGLQQHSLEYLGKIRLSDLLNEIPRTV